MVIFFVRRLEKTTRKQHDTPRLKWIRLYLWTLVNDKRVCGGGGVVGGVGSLSVCFKQMVATKRVFRPE